MKYSCGVDIVLNSRFNSYDDTKAKYFLTDKEFKEYLKKENSYKPILKSLLRTLKYLIIRTVNQFVQI